jgi:membrane protease YdiL (CAAX protease family)
VSVPVASRRAVWIRIATFVAVTYGFSAIFMSAAISSGEITAVSALGGMWSPLVGVFVTRLIFPDGRRRGSLSGLGWGWGRTGYQLLAVAVPILYVLASYTALWLAGIGRFASTTPSEFTFFVLRGVFRGLTLGSIFAFGEEVGWQGFLVPELRKVTSFTRAAFLRGVIWSVWHYPLIAGGVYGTTETPLWYRLVCFTVTMTAASFAFAWIRLRSGSLWTGVWMHASHNRFIQGIFPGLTVFGGAAAWYIDEMGVLTAAAAVLVAFVFWLRRGALSASRPSIARSA